MKRHAKARPAQPRVSSPEAAAAPGADEPALDRPRALRNTFPIVGVGASAGGLEAFRKLLAALPPDTGMAYVLVQHLDPRHESILAELLAKGSRMPVSEVREDTAFQPNHVYVTPGQQDVTIEGGMLKLVPRTSTRGQHMPIDSFLRTLAQAQGSKAIGVILSGTATDGTLGVKAIKAEGGIAFAQDPASAGHDGMPRSAIASGCVDFVLRPDEIARELSRLSRHPYVITPPREERASEPPPSVPKGEDGLRAILALLRKTTGTDFSSYKPTTINRRIARRMALVHVETLEDYARYLEGRRDEAQALYQDCLITVTSFFRDPETFQVLCDEVLPHLLKDRPTGAPIRVWVPGCATGEEVYSIVICLLERAGELKANSSFQVFATDLSESALEKARAGKYLENVAQDLSPERLQRFFTNVDGRYQVSKAIRDMCVFARHDLTRDPPFSRLDLISCRNMLIYLEPRLQQRVLAIFRYALKPSGFLLLGASETAGASPDVFAPVNKKHRIYSKRPTSAPAVFGLAVAEREDGRERRQPQPEAAKPAPREELPREADRILLARYAPAGVIVDEKDNIVEFRGQTDPYLEHSHGRASLNLFKMARKGLLLEIRQAIQEQSLARHLEEVEARASMGVLEVRIGLATKPDDVVLLVHDHARRCVPGQQDPVRFPGQLLAWAGLAASGCGWRRSRPSSLSATASPKTAGAEVGHLDRSGASCSRVRRRPVTRPPSRRPQQQETGGLEGVAEDGQHPLLQPRLEVDEHVPATDQVQAAERRVPGQVVPRENAAGWLCSPDNGRPHW